MSVNIIYDQILWDPLDPSDPSSGTEQKELVCHDCVSGVALTN